jgi:hypothetical protein
MHICRPNHPRRHEKGNGIEAIDEKPYRVGAVRMPWPTHPFPIKFSTRNSGEKFGVGQGDFGCYCRHTQPSAPQRSRRARSVREQRFETLR